MRIICSFKQIDFGDDGVEFLEVESFIRLGLVVDEGAVHELQKLLVVDGVVDDLGNVFQFLEVD